MANEGITSKLRKIPGKLKRAVQSPATYLFFVAIVFLVYQIYLLQNSFSALYNIALTATLRWQATGSVWNLVWLTSESLGEVGLLLRFTGACLFVTVAWLLFRQQRVSVPVLRKAVLLEATYFLLYIPFVIYLLTRPSSAATGSIAGLSYALQIALVSPSLFMLYRKLKGFEPGKDNVHMINWLAIAICSYIFALWVKGFLFALYAVGIDFSEPALVVGSVNSVATLLMAAVGALAVFLPFISGKRADFSWRGLGAILVCVGAYFVVFDLVSLVNAGYLDWVGLTEWWAASLMVLGVFFVARRTPSR
jgi:hypothetical protein